MKLIVCCLIFAAIFYQSKCEEQQPVSVENKMKIEHHDSSSLNMKGIREGINKTKKIIFKDSYQKTDKAKSQNVEQSTGNISKEIRKYKNLSFLLYKNGLCLVKDVRHIKVKSGKNKIEFCEIHPGLIEESINFRTLGKNKISILEYQFFRSDLSKESLFKKSLGSNVFYSLDNESKIENGKLVSIFQERETPYAVIRSEDKKRCDLIPLKNCVALEGAVLDKFGINRLSLIFESEEDGEIDLEISYLTKDILWKHYCLIEIFEKLDRIDIYSQALISNKTNVDIENATITFDTSSPSFSNMKNSNKISSSGTQVRRANISIGKNSEMTCVLRSTKALKPSLEYVIRIPMSMIIESALKEVKLQARNIFTINAADTIYGGNDFDDSEVLIFERRNSERTFLGKQSLSSMKRNSDFIFEIGYAPLIKGNVQQIDFKNVSDKYVEYGVKLSVKNESNSSSVVVIMIDTDSPWSISKKNFELLPSDKPMWKFDLEGGKSKDSYFRIRSRK